MTIQDTDVFVELTDVRKEFGDIVAVDGIDLRIRKGEFFSLVGPSGCGKTTTLRMISGFERPTSGTVTLGGVNARDVPPNDRDSNLVFQHLSLFPHLTVGENVAYGLKKSGVDADRRRELVEEYLELVDLGGFRDRKPEHLSGGQQQRVALARALVNEPSILLLDEPLSSLDRKLRKQMQVELRKIHDEVDGAFFYVTHDQEVAMTMSDRMAVMNEGQLEQVGTPEEIYREPATPFVADFIGDTTFFEGTARRVDGRTVVRLGDGSGNGNRPTLETGADVDEGRVTVSIRPEDIDVTDGNGTLHGTVVDRYFQGDQTQYVVDPETDALPEFNAVMQGQNTPVEPGDRASFSVADGGPVVFD
jgi:spermidine/putrescine transport system ATP-binding protein